jgi:hypothetical protein
MGTEVKECIREIATGFAALTKAVKLGLQEIQGEISGVKVALIEFHRDEQERHARLDGMLTDQQSRIAILERLAGSPSGELPS